MSGRIQLDVNGAVATVTLINASKFNAMSRAMWRQLRDVFLSLQSHDRVRVAVVKGEGGHFCAGGDIAEYTDFRFHPQGLRDFHESDVWGGLSAMLACDVPLIAQIEGNCMGAGVEIASCCDIRVAGQGARFGAPIAKLGFPMAPREAELVAREVGLATARQMLLEAAILDAATMLTRGYLQAVVPDGELPSEVCQRALRIARLAPQAARLNKQMLRVLALGAGAESLLETAYDYADSAEHREGIAAFLAKRAPAF